MKLVTTNLLDRFWRNGINPIKEAISNTLKKTDIVDHLLATVKGKPLDSTQGKKLKDLHDALKSQVTSLNSKLIFSTAETAIGTWVDGRTIYRKCFIIGQLANATSTTRAHSIPNLDRPIRLYGSAKDTTISTNLTVSLPYVSSSDVTKQINIAANNTNVVLYHATGNNKYSAVVVMEYIKTQ